VRIAIEANAFERSIREFEAFAFELQRQLRAEEDVIFRELELLEAASRDRAALTLWLEHEEIRMKLDSIRHAFNDGEFPRQDIEGLQQLLSTHKVREELLLCSRLELEEEPEAARRILRCLELCLAW
jgi:ferredoxin-NADP reductase